MYLQMFQAVLKIKDTPSMWHAMTQSKMIYKSKKSCTNQKKWKK